MTAPANITDCLRRQIADSDKADEELVREVLR